MKFPNFLRIAIVTNIGIFHINSSEDARIQVIDGLEYGFLKALSEALNFTYEVYVPSDGEWGRNLGNGRWSGMIGMVARNEVDIAVGKIGISHERSTVVDFSYPYKVERITFATAPPGVRSKATAIFLPFTKKLWIAISLTAVLVMFVFKLIFNRKYEYRRIIWHIFGSLLKTSGSVKCKKLQERILNSTWLFGSMVLSCSFSAVLLSFLTVPQKEPTISDKNSLLEVVEKGLYKCYTLRGSSQLHILETSTDEKVVSLAKHIVKNDWMISPGWQNVARILQKPNTAVILPERNLGFLLTDTVEAPDIFTLIFSGIAVNKNFCCKSAIDTFIQRFVAGGMYEKLRSDFVFRSQLKYRKKLSDRSNLSPLTFQDILGAFVVLACGYFLSCVSLVVEIIINYMKYDTMKSKSSRNRRRTK